MMKMTKKQMFSVFSALVNGTLTADMLPQEDKDFLTEKIAHEVGLLNKKSSSKGSTPSKTQKENEEIKARLLEYLEEAEKPVRVCEVIADERFPYSSSKISRLLNDMAKSDECPVMRTEVKKVAYFGV